MKPTSQIMELCPCGESEKIVEQIVGDVSMEVAHVVGLLGENKVEEALEHLDAWTKDLEG